MRFAVLVDLLRFQMRGHGGGHLFEFVHAADLGQEVSALELQAVAVELRHFAAADAVSQCGRVIVAALHHSEVDGNGFEI